MNIRKEMTKGSSALLVLSVLEKKEMYGYLIVKEIRVRSDGAFDLKEGTLYPILHAFEKEGMVSSYWSESPEGRKRKYYQITKKGIKELEKSKKEWLSYTESVRSVLEGGMARAIV